MVGGYDCIFITLLLHIGFEDTVHRLVFRPWWISQCNSLSEFCYAFHELKHYLGHNYRMILQEMDIWKVSNPGYHSAGSVKSHFLENPVLHIISGWSRCLGKELGMDTLRLMKSYCDLEVTCSDFGRSQQMFEKVRYQKRFDGLHIVYNHRHYRRYIYLCQTVDVMFRTVSHRS